MGPSQSKLAEAINKLVAAGRVTVTEAATSIAVYQLNGTEADSIYDLFEQAKWINLVCRDAGGEIDRHQIVENGEGLQITAGRPTVPKGVETILTVSGFESALDREPGASVVWVEGLKAAIDTKLVRYSPWWSGDPFTPDESTASVAKVTRVLGRKGPGTHLGRWLLKSPAAVVQDEAIKPWRVRAASRLLRSMAQEIELDDRLLFKGPPSARFTVTNQEDLTPASFAALQSVASWLLENEREVENRQGLLAAEIARTAVRDGNAGDLVSVLPTALEGARIAYNFGVTQQSRDTLKALGDLRKAVSDDTAKLSETMRSIGAAVVGAVFANIGLIVARMTLPPNGSKFIGQAAILVGVVLTVYVASIIISGIHYLWLQAYLRKEWRNSLYKFLAQDDYKRLVEVPVFRAEVGFWIMVGVGTILVCISLAALWTIAGA